jgi:hypothetical protein
MYTYAHDVRHHAMMSVHLLIPDIPNSESAGGTKNERLWKCRFHLVNGQGQTLPMRGDGESE